MYEFIHPVRGICVLLAALVLFAPTTLSAQEDEPEPVEITEAQQTLNDEGVRAMIEGDFAGAVALLERSIRMGENNVTYLNLGRAYQKLGNCKNARKALVMAKTAPPVKDPPEAEVTERAEEFLEELDEQCGTEEPAVEDQDEAAPVDEPEPAAEEPAVEQAETSDVAPPPNTRTWGWATLAPGIALIGTGVGLHFIAESKRNQITEPSQTNEQGIVEPTQREAYNLRDSANTMDTVALGMAVGGGVLSAFGTYLIIKGSNAERNYVNLSVGAGPGGASLVVGGRF